MNPNEEHAALGQATMPEKALLAKAREVLEPFKVLADKFEEEPYKSAYPDSARLTGENFPDSAVAFHNFITLGHCRHAKIIWELLPERNESSSAGGELWSYVSVDMDGYGGIARFTGCDIKCGDKTILHQLPISQVVAQKICNARNATHLAASTPAAPERNTGKTECRQALERAVDFTAKAARLIDSPQFAEDNRHAAHSYLRDVIGILEKCLSASGVRSDASSVSSPKRFRSAAEEIILGNTFQALQTHSSAPSSAGQEEGEWAEQLADCVSLLLVSCSDQKSWEEATVLLKSYTARTKEASHGC